MHGRGFKVLDVDPGMARSAAGTGSKRGREEFPDPLLAQPVRKVIRTLLSRAYVCDLWWQQWHCQVLREPRCTDITRLRAGRPSDGSYRCTETAEG